MTIDKESSWRIRKLMVIADINLLAKGISWSVKDFYENFKILSQEENPHA